MRVRFLRHAESEFNRDPTSCKRDCPLTELGRQQVASLHGHYSLVIVSPLLRAQQTLQHSAITYDRLELSQLVREHRVDPCDFLLGEEEETAVESEAELMRRGDLLLLQLRGLSCEHRSVLVVSHYDLICSVTGQSLGNAEAVDLLL